MTSWPTKITSIRENEILIQGFPIEELMGEASFSDVIFIALKGTIPSETEKKIFNAILVSSIDHGVTPPSALAVMNSASTGAPLNAALASGLLSINNFHGGAIENTMKLLLECAEKIDFSLDYEKTCHFVREKFNKKFRFPGFGHRVHTVDPRSIMLKKISLELLACEKQYFISLVLLIEQAIHEIKGIALPVNVDGMIGATLLALGFEPDLANGIFMISRLPGLLAHYMEEKKSQKPMIAPHAI